MSFKDIQKAAITNKTDTKLTVEFIEFKKKGVSILGRFIASNSVPGKRGDTFYNQYLFETDDGHVKFHCGAVFDNEGGRLMHIDGIYALTFIEKVDIGGGQSVNRFDLIHYPTDTPDKVGGDDDTAPNDAD